jgi:hypothetical protein
MIKRLTLCHLLLLPTLAWASEDSWLEKDRLNLNIGGLYAEFDSSARISGDRAGTDIEFEDDLGVDDTELLLRLEAIYRFTERSTMQFAFLELSRDGSATIERELIFDDTVYSAGSRIDTSFDFSALQLTYTYSIWQKPNYDIGFSAGIFVLDLEMELESDQGQNDSDGVTSPLPVVGVRGSWQLRPQLFLRGNLEYFKISEGDIDGQLANFLLALEYRFSGIWGVGAGYRDVHLELEDSDSDDELEYDYQGLYLYLNLVY